MGLTDVLFGRKKLKGPSEDSLFALTTACVTLQTELGLKPAGVGAVTYKSLSSGDFDRVDTDKNGSISFAEFEARRDDRREAREERRGPGGDGPRFADRGPGMRGGPGMPGMPGMGGGRGMARMADADNEGTVTQAEFTTAALARFDQADANSDGTISLEERREARQHMRGMMHRGGRDAS